ncbi:hypothetical protein ABW19_dt0201446 [Dactylella cylindrospora]|nr:hypothetical protein ABW19_dt0201446 [Dactylella cylindrospora]
MPNLKGIACNIHIDDLPAVEYGIQVEGSTVTCSIVSEDDAPFKFYFNFQGSPAERHDFKVYCDGLEVCFLTTTKRIEECRESYKVIAGQAQRRRLQFAKLETVDQKVDGLENRSNILKEVGTLKCEIWRAQFLAPPVVARDSADISQIDNVHEKSLKGRGVSHKTALGPAAYYPPNTVSTSRLDPPNAPYATFIFRYASRRHLQSEGLIPRSPSPLIVKHGGVDDDDVIPVEAMSADALRREVVRLRNAGRRKKPVKRERDATLGPASPADTDEVTIVSAREVKKPKLSEIEVIDLVDVDD